MSERLVMRLGLWDAIVVAALFPDEQCEKAEGR